MLDNKLRKILKEYKCDIEYNGQNEKLICHNCKLAYRIEDDIPIMLIEEAEKTS